MSDPCPCSPQLHYSECCQPYHDGTAVPASAELLMRSRYSAYVHKDIDYIIATTVPAVQTLLDKDSLQAWADGMHWTRLDIVSHNQVGKRHAQVHFKAYFKRGGELGCHDERSAFVLIDGRWYFLDPTVATGLTNKQPCLCGSGLKYKACCGGFLV